MSEKIIVTGGAGLIGREVVKALAKRGHEIVAFDRGNPEEREIVSPSSVEVVTGDLHNKDDIQRLLHGRKVSAVIHLAADIGPLSYMEENKDDIYSNNVIGDTNLFDAIAESGIKTIVYASSSMVFQHAKRYPYNEEDLDSTPPPTNLYGLSKVAGEKLLRELHKKGKLNFVIMRYHGVVGLDEKPKGKGSEFVHVLPALVGKVVQGDYPIEILNNPAEESRTFTHINDIVSATVGLTEAALHHDQNVLNEDFNISSGKEITILNLARRIWELLGDNRPFSYTTRTVAADTAVRRFAQSRKLEKAIGWEPKKNLDDMIGDVAKALKQ